MAQVYTAGGEVLMGTLRHEKEREKIKERRAAQAQSEQRQLQLELETNELEAKVASLSRELEAKRSQRTDLKSLQNEQTRDWADAEDSIRELRGGDHRDK